MTDAVPDALVATLAERYRVERKLGEGGMASVYLAQDLRHDRPVALKVLRAEAGAALGTERFLQEIRVAARLQHPHIVGVIDSGMVPGAGGTAVPYYVMPYVEGETLRVRLARGPLPVAEAVALARELADALACAHAAGVVHRDIKPENILLAGGHAFVMDFGVAKAVSAATGTQGMTSAGFSLGTPAYMAPEQVAADPRVDHRADLYALGVVLYEMLAGGSPYAASTPQQQMAAHVTQPPAPLRGRRPEVPEALAALVMRCLAKQPEARPPGAMAVLSGLRGVELAGAAGGRATRVLVAAVAVAVVAAGALALRSWRGGAAGGAGPAAPPTVGVMLFDNLTHDTAYAYLGDGLASEIAMTLARVPRLEVRSPGAVRGAQKDGAADPLEVGRRLNVGNVVEGEFQRAGDKLRVAVRLVAVPSGTQRWGDSWTRPAGDLLQVQAEIARAVAGAIAGTLLPEEESALAVRLTTSPEAYDHFLRGNFLLASRTPAGVRRAMDEYRLALARDSTLARAAARAALGYMLFLSWGWQYPGLPADSLVAVGLRAADRALALDSATADAWVVRAGLLAMRDPIHRTGVMPALERAVALEPRNAEVQHQVATQLLFSGHFDEAVAAFRRSLALERGRPVTWEDMGLALELLGQDSAASAAMDSALAVDTSYFAAYASRSRLRLRAGDRAGARADAEAALRHSPPGEEAWGLGPLAMVRAAEGDTAGARELLARALAPFERRPLGANHAWLLGQGFMAVNARAQALTVLERTESRGMFLWWALQFRGFDPVRQEPRFQRLLAANRPDDAP
ncbi:MAG: protein kinase [Gemmatimonadetes bacterium]|nr:protein kinase [Gemmatimonadota bacterium]